MHFLKINVVYNITKYESSGDYMIPVCPDEISTCPAGADLTVLLNGEI